MDAQNCKKGIEEKVYILRRSSRRNVLVRLESTISKFRHVLSGDEGSIRKGGFLNARESECESTVARFKGNAAQLISCMADSGVCLRN